MYAPNLLIPWDALTYESWRRGDLAWKLRPEQRELKDRIESQKVQLVVGNISRRFGKSFILVVLSCERCRKGGRRAKIRYGAAFKSDLEEFILPAFEIILLDCPEEFRPTYIASKQTWVFPDGARIKLIGLDKNPNGMRGNALSMVIIDEAGFVARLKYLLESVIWPATMKQKDIKILVFSTPPESPEHYFVELKDKAENHDDPDSVYLEMTIDDISDLDPAEKERMLEKAGGRDSATAQREYYCKIIIDPTRAIAPHFNAEIHVRAYEPEHVAWRIFGDTAAIHKTVFLKMGFCRDSGLTVVRAEYNPPQRSATSDIIDGYKKKYPESYSLVADMPEQLRIDYAALGLPSSPPQKDHFDAGRMLMNNAFRNNSVLIHPDCTLLIKTLKGGLTTKNGTDFEESESLGHCDAAAAFIYGLRGVDKVTDVRPPPDRMKVFAPRQEPQFLKNLKGLGYQR